MYIRRCVGKKNNLIRFRSLIPLIFPDGNFIGIHQACIRYIEEQNARSANLCNGVYLQEDNGEFSSMVISRVPQ